MANGPVTGEETFGLADTLQWLALLYATLYVLVGAEDYALLAGSGLVLALIAATMYLTRRIDWYAFGAPVPPELPTAAEQAS